ncbi:MAG: hypothetical protein AABX77_01245 [Nanoarchaeota archaeon]|mgnify:FL=1
MNETTITKIRDIMKNIPIDAKAYRLMNSYLNIGNYEGFLRLNHIVYTEVFNSYINIKSNNLEKRKYAQFLEQMVQISYFIHNHLDKHSGGKK